MVRCIAVVADIVLEAGHAVLEVPRILAVVDASRMVAGEPHTVPGELHGLAAGVSHMEAAERHIGPVVARSPAVAGVSRMEAEGAHCTGDPVEDIGPEERRSLAEAGIRRTADLEVVVRCNSSFCVLGSGRCG